MMVYALTRKDQRLRVFRETFEHEGIDQGGFPDSGFAGHEDHLTFTALGLEPALPQDIERVLPSDYMWSERHANSGRSCAETILHTVTGVSSGLHRPDEAITVRMNCFDETWCSSTISQRVPDLGHLRLEHAVTGVYTSPKASEQLRSGEQFAWMGQQIVQHRKGQRFDVNANILSPESLLHRIETKGWEHDGAANAGSA